MRNGFSVCAAVGALLVACSAGAVGVPGQGTWETTLVPRDLDGNAVNGPEAFYDTALDITWLRDANYASTSGYAGAGWMRWAAANTWANTLVVNGIDGWRLPTMVDLGAAGCDNSEESFSGGDCGWNVQTATSEMAHLWYVALGNKAFYDTSGRSNQPVWGLSNSGSFQNLESDAYWSSLPYVLDPDWVWIFSIGAGVQTAGSGQYNGHYALAVHPGDVAAIPEPQTYALMLMGLSALVLRRKSR